MSADPMSPEEERDALAELLDQSLAREKAAEAERDEARKALRIGQEALAEALRLREAAEERAERLRAALTEIGWPLIEYDHGFSASSRARRAIAADDAARGAR